MCAAEWVLCVYAKAVALGNTSQCRCRACRVCTRVPVQNKPIFTHSGPHPAEADHVQRPRPPPGYHSPDTRRRTIVLPDCLFRVSGVLVLSIPLLPRSTCLVRPTESRLPPTHYSPCRTAFWGPHLRCPCSCGKLCVVPRFWGDYGTMVFWLFSYRCGGTRSVDGRLLGLFSGAMGVSWAGLSPPTAAPETSPAAACLGTGQTVPHDQLGFRTGGDLLLSPKPLWILTVGCSGGQAYVWRLLE